MSRPSLPDETQRLGRLHELRILDTAPEPSFDAAVSLAARLTGCPIALLGFMDRDRHWFKSVVGAEAREVPRELALCNQTLHEDGLTVVEDLTADPRFAQHPFVVDTYRLRFFASLPLRVEGAVVATLCVYDLRSRTLDAPARQGLHQLGLMLENMLALRLKEQRSRMQEARVRTAGLAGNDWLWESDAEGRITWVSASLERHTGLRPEDEIGQTAREFFHPCSDPAHRSDHAAYIQARQARQPFSQLVMERETPRGRLAVSVSGVPVFDSSGRFRGYRGATRVVTEELRLQQQARQVQRLLQEAIDSVGAGIVITDAHDRIVHANRAWREGLGCHVQGLESACWTEALERAVRAGDYPDAIGREDEFLAWHTAARPEGAAPLEMRWRDRWILLTEEPIASGGHIRVAVDITARRRAEQELEQRDAQLQIMRRAMEAETALPMTVVDALAPDMPLVYVNPSFERLTGYRREEILGRNCRFLQCEDTDPVMLAALRSALARGESCTVVLRNQRKDGSRFLNELHVAPLRDAQGRITHFIGLQNDITERSAAADRLRLSEELYRSVALSISDGLMVLTRDHYVVAVNPAACRILDASMDTLMMRPGLELLSEDLRPLPAQAHPVTRSLQTGKPVTEEVYAVRGRDGSPRWLAVNTQPLRLSPDEPPMSAVLTFRDITRQRQAELALAQSEQRWKFALEGSGDGVWDWDVQAGTVYYSRSWRANLGYAHDELSNDPREWRERVHPEDWPQVRAALVAHLKGRTEVYQSEHRMRHRDGQYLCVFERGKVMVRSPDGRALRVVGTYSDITRLKQAEQALRDKRAAELASQAKTEFLSRMSHEMRTPLNAMIGFAQLLAMSAGQPHAAQIRDYATHMLQAGRHLLALINDVLDLQRVEAGQLALSMGPVSLREASAQTQELLAPLAREYRIDIENLIPMDTHVRADPQRLRQVLLNIVSNAIKYNRPGGRVTLQAGDAAEHRVSIEVTDTGAGLDAAQLERLFQPFERLGRETSGIEGTGLGLFIAKRLIEEMGGRIHVRSSVGTGTTVSLELPRADAATANTIGAASTDPAPSMPSRIGPLRLLYVEDNPVNALLFREAMTLCEHIELQVAEDGERAFDLVRHWRPDVIVLDAHLPGMSGFDVLQGLRRDHGLHDIPAFMCSADAMPEDIERARQAGFAGYWTKPIALPQVLADIARVRRRPDPED
ncbi:MAG: hypothetical protein KatS3mg122_2682 [Caldimonas sp.]|nr:MAG: hypothetical protein KatS3mg122_2682 [Caldimonas sp.]